MMGTPKVGRGLQMVASQDAEATLNTAAGLAQFHIPARSTRWREFAVIES